MGKNRGFPASDFRPLAYAEIRTTRGHADGNVPVIIPGKYSYFPTLDFLHI